jgi:hypothetical protein
MPLGSPLFPHYLLFYADDMQFIAWDVPSLSAMIQHTVGYLALVGLGVKSRKSWYTCSDVTIQLVDLNLAIVEGPVFRVPAVTNGSVKRYLGRWYSAELHPKLEASKVRRVTLVLQQITTLRLTLGQLQRIWVSLIGSAVSYQAPQRPTGEDPVLRRLDRLGRVMFRSVLRLPSDYPDDWLQLPPTLGGGLTPMGSVLALAQSRHWLALESPPSATHGGLWPLHVANARRSAEYCGCLLLPDTAPTPTATRLWKQLHGQSATAECIMVVDAACASRGDCIIPVTSTKVGPQTAPTHEADMESLRWFAVPVAHYEILKRDGIKHQSDVAKLLPEGLHWLHSNLRGTSILQLLLHDPAISTDSSAPSIYPVLHPGHSAIPRLVPPARLKWHDVRIQGPDGVIDSWREMASIPPPRPLLCPWCEESQPPFGATSLRVLDSLQPLTALRGVPASLRLPTPVPLIPIAAELPLGLVQTSITWGEPVDLDMAEAAGRHLFVSRGPVRLASIVPHAVLTSERPPTASWRNSKHRCRPELDGAEPPVVGHMGLSDFMGSPGSPPEEHPGLRGICGFWGPIGVMKGCMQRMNLVWILPRVWSFNPRRTCPTDAWPHGLRLPAWSGHVWICIAPYTDRLVGPLCHRWRVPWRPMQGHRTRW